ncbi:hypothetical protein [Aureimonas glaciei]|nr:hypothetical protein [Aureimonas glaciei]
MAPLHHTATTSMPVTPAALTAMVPSHTGDELRPARAIAADAEAGR